MSFFRSEDVMRCQLFLQTDALYQSVVNLGELGAIQFIDTNEHVNQFKRTFTNEIRRIDDLQRKLRYFESELKKLGKEIPEADDYPSTPAPKELIEMEAAFDEHEKILKEVSRNIVTMENHLIGMMELCSVLDKSEQFFLTVGQTRKLSRRQSSVTEMNQLQSYELVNYRKGSMWYSTGVVPFEKVQNFCKAVWLSSHGNTILHIVNDPPTSKRKRKWKLTDSEHEKPVFIAICQSEQLQKQLEKIAKGYKATIYPYPKTLVEREEMWAQVQQRIDDLEIIIEKSKEQVANKLEDIFRDFYTWRIKLTKMKACFYTMNMFKQEIHGYIAEGYVPVCELKNIQAALISANESVGNKEPPVITPIKSVALPTYYKTNRFTAAFQAIIESYGIARYKEINPAFFSIISFPFLFSVMFGDAGHGLVMLCFALTLCIWEKKLKRPASSNEIFSIIFGGRYLVLVMGIFSIYSGLMYNDFFSKPINIFGSKYHILYDLNTMVENKVLQVDVADPKVYYGVPYPLGLDPIWELAENKITYLNSFKKKISVIFGVSQMTLGVVLGLLNHVYFKDYLRIFCEFLPMILFLMSIFGYMCGLIFAKWLLYVDSTDPQVIATFYQCSPNILIGFINMFMMKYAEPTQDQCSIRTWYEFQKDVQMGLVALALVCIVWLLLTKPLILLARHRRKYKVLPVEVSESQVDESSPAPKSPAPKSQASDPQLPASNVIEMTDKAPILENDHPQNEAEAKAKASVDLTEENNEYLKQFTMPLGEEEQFDFGEVFIHQAIHTIEFCLGCVSHTASYLRLWALSLAHAQLSEVLWRMVLRHGFDLDLLMVLKVILTYALVCPFAVLSVIILLIMEGLSAFLHTLRLHWVEFNSKFYYGDGVPFQPFYFHDIIHAREE